MKAYTTIGILLPLLFLAACTPAEMIRRTVGTSIRDLEREEEGRFAGIVEAGFRDSYAALYDVLVDHQVYIYLDSPRKRYLVAMGFDRLYPRTVDTTRVGFFFLEESPEATRIEVVSTNPDLARFAAELVFEGIDGLEWISMRAQPD